MACEDGGYIPWNGILNTGTTMAERKYMVNSRLGVLKFTLDKRSVIFKGKEASLLFIHEANKTEQDHARITEGKYSQLLVSTITHDLKSPVTAIQGNLELLTQYVNSQGTSHLKAAQLAAQGFEYYIYDLVDFSQILEGAFHLTKDVIKPEEIVDKLKAMIIPKAEIRNISCEIKTETRLPKSFVGDMRRILQVILNLASNCVKYTFHGGFSIRFWQTPAVGSETVSSPGTVENSSEAPLNLCIEVKDTGVGISPENIEKTTKLFGLLDRKTTCNETGIGLGLLVSKCILNAMRGKLKITSEVGIGTTCEVIIPMYNPAGPDPVFFVASIKYENEGKK